MFVDLNGYDAIVRDDETNEILVMGKVEVYDKVRNMIEMDAHVRPGMEHRKMRVLVYHEGMAYSFFGTYRKLLGQDRVGIALYKGTIKSDRKMERYPLNIQAEIFSHRPLDQKSVIDQVCMIHVLDISRGGIGIEGRDFELAKGDKIGVRFAVGSEIKIYYARILRVGKKDEETGFTEYGCEFITQLQFHKVDPIPEEQKEVSDQADAGEDAKRVSNADMQESTEEQTTLQEQDTDVSEPQEAIELESLIQ